MTNWDPHRRRRHVPGSEWPAVIAMIPVGAAVIATGLVGDAVRAIARRLRDRPEAHIGLWSNQAIDQLPEEEVSAP